MLLTASVTQSAPTTLSQVLSSLKAGDPGGASSALERLLEGPPPEAAALKRLWASFQSLLERRGYFVATPAELETSLREIADLGEGFDLHDLARALARFDAALTECGPRTQPRRFPQISRFAPRCECTRHPKKGDPR